APKTASSPVVSPEGVSSVDMSPGSQADGQTGGQTGDGQSAVPAAPVATTGAASDADGCRIAFTATSIEDAVPRLKNVATGKWYYPPSGKEFVVVNTTIGNKGTGACTASPGQQRGYTAATTFTAGDKAAGDQLYRGRRMNRSFAPDENTTGAFVFVVPKGKELTQVGLRKNGSSNWTIVRK
ncbi:DUF4352 domain-containing protein, partial [Actinocorallia lasiicapitis]